MIFRALWDFPAKSTFYRLSVAESSSVDRAIVAFAERGEGELKREPPHWILQAGAHVAVLAIDLELRTVTVLHIFRAGR